MKSRLHSLIAAAALFTALFAPTARSQSSTHYGLTLQVDTDLLAPVPQAVALVDDGTAIWSFQTAADGSVATAQMAIGATLDVTLGAAATTLGETVGQRFVDTTGVTVSGIGSHFLHYFQPEARTVTFDSNDPFTQDLAASTYWVASPIEGAYYDFDAKVANLSCTDIIDRVFDYENATPARVYQQGVLMRMDAPYDLGSEGLLLQIDLRGRTYAGRVTVDKVVFSNQTPQGSLIANVISVQGERALIRVRGWLAQGDNLLLLWGNPNSTGGAYLHLPKQPEPVPGTNNPPLPAATPSCPPCTLTLPSSCTPPPGTTITTPSNDCGAIARTGTRVESCTPRWTGSIQCAAPGTSITTSTTVTYKGQFSFTLGASGGPSATGSFGVDVSRTYAITISSCFCTQPAIGEWRVAEDYDVCETFYYFNSDFPYIHSTTAWMKVTAGESGEYQFVPDASCRMYCPPLCP